MTNRSVAFTDRRENGQIVWYVDANQLLDRQIDREMARRIDRNANDPRNTKKKKKLTSKQKEYFFPA